MFKYALLNSESVCIAVVESSRDVARIGVRVESGESVLGKKREGSKWVEVEVVKRYRILSKTEFILILGQQVFDLIVDSDNKDLRFMKYVLDSAEFVDFNRPEFLAMVTGLVPDLVSELQLAALLQYE